jgi:hypothetical protein
MHFIITHVHEKLLSLNNTNEPSSENISQSPDASANNIPSDPEKEDEVGKSV